MKKALELKNNFYHQYYLINYEWFNKYLESNNMNELYNYIVNNKIIENIILKNKIIEKESIIDQVLSKLNQDLINKIKNDNNYENLKNNNLFYPKKKKMKKNENTIITYYSNFLLLKKESIDYFSSELIFNFNTIDFLCILGENKIFIKFDAGNQFNLEIGHISQQNIFIPEVLFNYITQSDLNNNIFSLINNTYKQYCEKFLKNENNSIAIFNKSNNIIGNAYILNKKINITGNYPVNEDLNILINYYFLNYRFDFYPDKIIEKKFFLVNDSFVNYYKKFWKYDNLYTELNKNNLVNQIKNEFKDDINKNISNENIIEIVKSLPSEIKDIFNKKEAKDKYINHYPCEPNIHTFILDSINYFHYNDLILLNESIYNYLIKKQSSIKKETKNYLQCYIINKYILFPVPDDINESKKTVIEICYFNVQKILNIKYLLIFDNKNDFELYLKYIIRVFGMEDFLNGLNFTTNNIKLYDNKNKEIGIIINIMMKENKSFQNNNNIINDNTIENNNIQNNIYTSRLNNTSIKDIFPCPPLLGLKNIEEFSNFANAVLQCFCHIEKIVNYFKYKPRITEIINLYQNQKKEISLTNLFKILIENIWPSDNNFIDKSNVFHNDNNNYYSPNNFKENIMKIYPGIKEPLNKDPKNLIIYIIKRLHEELNKAQNNNNNSESLFKDENQSDKFIKFSNFATKFANENKSLISDIFYGINYYSIQCSFCKIINYEFDIFYFLTFPIEEIKEYKIQQIQNQINLMNNMMNINPSQNIQSVDFNLNSINIYDCFQYKKDNIDTFTGAGSLNCDSCGNILAYTSQTNLYIAPEILIIDINRGRDFEINLKFDFFEDLNLINFIEMKNTGHNFKLIGVITYIGKNDENKKYISFCKNPIDYKWYKFNNELVTSVVDFQNEIVNNETPYILFYQKIKYI